MGSRYYLTVFLTLAFVVGSFGCSKNDKAASNGEQITIRRPASDLTTSDLTRLKWIEGTWRGTDGDKSFFERYRFENDSVMVVETFSDDTLSKVEDTSRFELKNGEFGHTDGDQRSVASSITDNAVQFVPVGKGNYYRFERLPDGNWQAVLEWPAVDGKATRQKVYKMERVP